MCNDANYHFLNLIFPQNLTGKISMFFRFDLILNENHKSANNLVAFFFQFPIIRFLLNFQETKKIICTQLLSLYFKSLIKNYYILDFFFFGHGFKSKNQFLKKKKYGSKVRLSTTTSLIPHKKVGALSTEYKIFTLNTFFF